MTTPTSTKAEIDDLMRLAGRLESLPLTFDVVMVRKQRAELRAAIESFATEAIAAERAEVERLRAECEKLRAALTPFVDFPEDYFDLSNHDKFTMTVLGVNLHNARAALATPTKGEKS